MRGKWYCKVAGQVQGPMSSHELALMARENRISREDQVRRNDSPWVPADKVKGLFEDPVPVPPPPDPPPAPPAKIFPEPSATDTSAAEDALSSETIADNDDIWEDEVLIEGDTEEPVDQMDSDSAIARKLAPGSLLGNYVVLEKLGEGGMGWVLKAQHRRMQRTVALKVLHGEATRSIDAIRRFHQEARAAARLVHANIVNALDADESQGIHFLVMEYVEGVVLSELLGRKGPLPVRDAVNYTLQVAHGLAYAHGEGVIHRDIKPGNLLLDKRGVVKILDMGLARLEETVAALADAARPERITSAGQMLGTLDYMSPEQAEDAHSVDHRTDIYSLGCTMFRLLTGRPPYRGQTIVEKIVAHRDQPIPSLSAARPEVPADLDLIFQRMVAKRPDDRYQSMNDVVQDLETLLAKGRVPSQPRPAKGAARPETANLRRARPLDEDETSACEMAEGDAFQLVEPSDTEERIAAVSKYFRQVFGEEIGPLSLSDLKRLKKKRQLAPDDLLRRDQQAAWFPASDLPGLFS
jgi:serine/threonine protein kinase